MYAVSWKGTVDDECFELFRAMTADWNAQDSNGDSVLFYAVETANVELVSKLIELGADVNHKNKNGQNVVHRIMQRERGTSGNKLATLNFVVGINRDLINKVDRNGLTPLNQRDVDTNLVKHLVELGANINTYSPEWGTILHKKIESEYYLDTVRWAFLNGFVRVNQVDKEGRTPLMFVIKEFGGVHDEVLHLFLVSRVDLHVQDKYGNTALLYAMRYSKSADFMKKILLGYGGDVNKKNWENQNALHVLIQNQRSTENMLEVVDNLVRIGNPGFADEKDNDGCTPLLQMNADFRFIQRLVQHGADINAYDRYHGTVLHTAKVDRGSYAKVVHWAFSKGFTLINHTDRHGRTPLLHAVSKFGVVCNEILQCFRTHGADFNAQDHEGDSVFLYAVGISENIEFIKKLLNLGADINHVNRDNENAMHALLKTRYFDIDIQLSILNLLASIDVEIIHRKDKHGGTPLLACKWDIRLLQRLVDHGADINAYSNYHGTLLHMPVDIICEEDRDGYVETVQWAFSNGFNLVNHAGQYQRTPIMDAIATFRENLDEHVFQLFNEAGSDWNAQDEDGDSVLFYFLRYIGNVTLTSQILDYGANANQSNNQSENAAHIIVKHSSRSNNWTKKLKLLILIESKGFNGFNQKNSNGYTPLELAKKERQNDDSEELLAYLEDRAN